MAHDPRTVLQVAHANALIESGIRYILEARGEFHVLPCSGAAARAITPIADVLVTDHDGGLRWARQDGAHAREVLVVALPGQEADLRAALDAGIKGYIVFGCSAADIVDGARALAQGRRYLCGTSVDRMAGSLAASPLTPREAEVLELVSRGHNNKEVARFLGISLPTVKSHMHGLMSKLGARCRTEALWIATRQGILARHPA